MAKERMGGAGEVVGFEPQQDVGHGQGKGMRGEVQQMAGSLGLI